MITLNYENLAKIDALHGLSEEELKKYSSQIGEYLEKVHLRDQEFYKVIDDEVHIKSIKDFASSVEGKYQDIVVCGIGGSAIGAICLQQSLKHLYENELSERSDPRLHVMDNIDPVMVAGLEDLIDYEKTLFLIVSKSGTTPEPLSLYLYFKGQVMEKGLEVKEHFAFITDPEKGLLRKIADDENIRTIDHANVGGRFAVLSGVGLLPASLIGIDIDKLLSGARSMRDNFLSEKWEDNFSFQLASIQFLLSGKGKTMNVMWPYSQRLIKFSDWFRQLLAESIGKAVNDKGETVNVGLTPVHALGATDQHSQSQLYNEGPNDKLFIFLEVLDHGVNLEIPNIHPEEEKTQFLKGVTFGKLLSVEKQGTEKSITENNRPNITLKLDKVSEENLGAMFLLFEGAIAFLGEFYEIDAFNQPGVELSKKITKELLLS